MEPSPNKSGQRLNRRKTWTKDVFCNEVWIFNLHSSASTSNKSTFAGRTLEPALLGRVATVSQGASNWTNWVHTTQFPTKALIVWFGFLTKVRSHKSSEFPTRRIKLHSFYKMIYPNYTYSWQNLAVACSGYFIFERGFLFLPGCSNGCSNP